jgi:hypothetical protein
VSQSSSLQTSELADDTVSGFLTPKLTRVPFISSSGEFQLLLSQPRQSDDYKKTEDLIVSLFDISVERKREGTRVALSSIKWNVH